MAPRDGYTCEWVECLHVILGVSINKTKAEHEASVDKSSAKGGDWPSSIVILGASNNDSQGVLQWAHGIFLTVYESLGTWTSACETGGEDAEADSDRGRAQTFFVTRRWRRPASSPHCC